MQSRAKLVERVLDILKRSSFAISMACHGKSCFDFLARRSMLLLLIKVLINIDTLTYEQAQEMFIISRNFSAYPLIVGIKTKQADMEEDVVYERFKIFAITPETLENILVYNTLPLIFSYRGGYYVRIDGEALKKVREERNLSLGDVAERIGVSRKTIYEYEHGNMCATLNTAIKLEELFEVSLAKPIEIFMSRDLEFSHSTVSKNSELKKLENIGFEVFPVKKAPFNALTKGEDEVLLTRVQLSSHRLEAKAKILRSISHTVNTQAFFIIRKTKQRCIKGIPVVKKSELEEMQDARELIELIRERANFI